jgi:indolepyruvate ferredoxin oxidoreductase
MTLHDISPADRFDLTKRTVLLGGIQALVRVLLMQKARDEADGWKTAGYVSGYRGSPLGAVDQQMARAEMVLAAADIRFEPGLNKDLAATALWGTQQAQLRGEGRVEGVFGLWCGKGPGIDRCGDVFRHANLAGTAPPGGVLVCMGDDHTGESSTTPHRLEFALVDACIPRRWTRRWRRSSAQCERCGSILRRRCWRAGMRRAGPGSASSGRG